MTVPLYEQVYRYILQQIKSGQLKHGDRVPSEKELAEQFHVSRITSKKALENLMQAHIVERIRGKGTFVMQSLPDLDQLDRVLDPEPSSQSPSTANDQPLIGFILEDFSASYGLHLLQAIEERCSERGMHMIMKRSYGRREEEEQAIHTLLQLGVDGLIVFPVHGDYYNPKLLKLVVDEFPLVLVDRYLKGVPAHCVYTDNRKAAYELTNFVLESGHTHIAFLSPPLENTSSIDDRLRGFTAALTDHGIPFNPQYCHTTLKNALSDTLSQLPMQQNQEELRQFIQHYPQITAFIACEYDIALLLRHLLYDLDPQKAQRTEIVCFDYVEQRFTPTLFTHIQQNEVAMGQQAVDVLFAQLKGQAAPLETVIPHTVVYAAERKAEIFAGRVQGS